MSPATERRTTAGRAVFLVIEREVVARMTAKSYLTGIFVSVVAVAGLMFSFGGSVKAPSYDLAVQGISAGALGPPGQGVRLHEVPDRETALRQTRSSAVGAAIVVHGDTAELLVRGDTSDRVRQLATALVQSWATDQALREQHVDLTQLRDQLQVAGPQVVSVSGSAYDSKQLGEALAIISVLFFQIFGSGMLVAQGVVEEKSSRVIEVLLATLTPLRLMVGKVIGIGVAAIVQIAALAAAAEVADRVGDVKLVSFPGTDSVLTAVAWFVPGFFFFAFLFAAAGSLVSRAEELQSVIMPVMLVTMVPFGIAIAAVQDISAHWVAVARYVPPFSTLLMPLEVTVHRVAAWQQLTAAALMVAAIAAAAYLAARVYRHSVLHVGSSLRWREALTR